MLVETEIFENYAYSREYVEYILVYNKEAAVKDTGIKGNSEVHTYTQEEFEEKFVKVYEDEQEDDYSDDSLFNRFGLLNPS